MAFMVSLAVMVVDPAGLVIVLVICSMSRKKWIIPVAAIIAALIAETVLTATQYTRAWGSGMPLTLLATTIQAVACYWLVSRIRAARK